MRPVTSPSPVAFTTSASTAEREDASTVATLTSYLAFAMTSATPCAFCSRMTRGTARGINVMGTSSGSYTSGRSTCFVDRTVQRQLSAAAGPADGYERTAGDVVRAAASDETQARAGVTAGRYAGAEPIRPRVTPLGGRSR